MRASGNWIAGLLFAGVLGVAGCGGALVLLGWVAAANITIMNAPDDERESVFAGNWRPPVPGAGADRLFPAQVKEWELVSLDDSTSIAELAIDRPGLHAWYTLGSGTVDVYVYEVPFAEQSDLFDAADDAIGRAGYGTMTSHRAGDLMSSRLQFSVSPPKSEGRLWWSRDWLFVFMTDDASVDLDEFRLEYLSGVSEQELPTTGN